MWQLEEDVIIKEQATSYMYGKDGTKRGKVLPTAKSWKYQSIILK